MPLPSSMASPPTFQEGQEAIHGYNSLLLEALLGRGLPPNATGGEEWFDLSLLGMACHHGDAACVEVLLEAGADASVVDNRNFSTLFLYAQFTEPPYFEEDVCLALMEAGADPWLETHSGESAMSKAAEVSSEMAEAMVRAWSQIEKKRLTTALPKAQKGRAGPAL